MGLEKGLDWLSLKEFYSWSAILFILSIVSIVLVLQLIYIFDPQISGANMALLIVVGICFSLISSFITFFVIVPRALKYYGCKTEFGNATVGNFVEFLKLLILNLVVVLFNWKQQKVLAIQVVSVAAILLVLITSGSIPSDIFNLTSYLQKLFGNPLFILAIISFSLAAMYSVLRYAYLPYVRFCESKSALGALDDALALSEGRTWQSLGMVFLLVISFMVLILVVALVIHGDYNAPIYIGMITASASAHVTVTGEAIGLPFYIIQSLLVVASTMTSIFAWASNYVTIKEIKVSTK